MSNCIYCQTSDNKCANCKEKDTLLYLADPDCDICYGRGYTLRTISCSRIEEACICTEDLDYWDDDEDEDYYYEDEYEEY